MNALLHSYNYRQIEKGLDKVRWATDSELTNIYNSFREAYRESPSKISSEAQDAFNLMYPNLTRDTGADILGVVAWSVGEVILVDESDFEKDTLMCEGVYTIDFQQKLFTSVYHSKMVAFSLTMLPTREQYLKAWENLLDESY